MRSRSDGGASNDDTSVWGSDYRLACSKYRRWSGRCLYNRPCASRKSVSTAIDHGLRRANGDAVASHSCLNTRCDGRASDDDTTIRSLDYGRTSYQYRTSRGGSGQRIRPATRDDMIGPNRERCAGDLRCTAWHNRRASNDYPAIRITDDRVAVCYDRIGRIGACSCP